MSTLFKFNFIYLINYQKLNNVHSDLKDLGDKSRKLVEDNVFLRGELEKKNQLISF